VLPRGLRRGQVNFRLHNSCGSLRTPSPGRRRACVLFGVFFRGGYSPTGLPGDTVWLALPPTGWGGLSVLSQKARSDRPSRPISFFLADACRACAQLVAVKATRRFGARLLAAELELGSWVHTLGLSRATALVDDKASGRQRCCSPYRAPGRCAPCIIPPPPSALVLRWVPHHLRGPIRLGVSSNIDPWHPVRRAAARASRSKAAGTQVTDGCEKPGSKDRASVLHGHRPAATAQRSTPIPPRAPKTPGRRRVVSCRRHCGAFCPSEALSHA